MYLKYNIEFNYEILFLNFIRIFNPLFNDELLH